MRLATSTNFFGPKLSNEYTSYIESVRRCKEAGFKVIDVNFSNALGGKTDLYQDNWKQLIADLKNESEKLGIEFSQSHPVFLPRDFENQTSEKMELYHVMMHRSIIASAMLDVKWAVLHPVEERVKSIFDVDANIQKNFEFFEPVMELAKQHNVGIAFENMSETSYSKRRFCTTADELNALIDAYNDSKVGACWDFGHGNITYPDQRIALRKVGSRLKATHVDDNFGVSDNHLFPFHGTIDWHLIMPVLTEINYQGDFTFETHREFDRLPDYLKDHIAKIGYEIGVYCLTLA